MIRKVFLSTINYDHPQKGMHHGFYGLFGRENISEYDYYQRSLSVGNENANREFFEAAVSAAPDWIWLQLQMTKVIRPETITALRERLPKTVISHWMGDCRAAVDPYLANVCKVTHLSLVSNSGQLQMFRDAGAPVALYCQIGVDWEEDVIGVPHWEPPFRVPQVVLLGNHYGGAYPGTVDREFAMRTLIDAGIDAGVVGDGWEKWANPVGKCHVKQQYHVWTKAKVGLCVNNFNDVELHYSDRQVISMASGTPIVCYEVPGLRREFEDGKECLMYRTGPQLLEAVRKLLSDEAYRVQVGLAGRAKIMKEHTWFSRILGVLPEVERIQKTLA